MKRIVASTLLIILSVGVGAALADSHERTVAIWTCKVEDGKTIEDVQAVNGKWVKLANEALEEGEIHSYVMTTTVGDLTTFLFVDSFPSGEAWVGTRTAMDSEAGKALDKEFDEVSSCSSNSLYSSEQSMPPTE